MKMADTPESAVNFNNVKNVGELHAVSMGMLVQGMVASQLRQNDAANLAAQNHAVLSQAATLMGVNKVLNLDPAEAIALLKATSGNDLAQQIAGLIAGTAGGQQAVKGAVTTPPETGGA
jgi:hypothetical protein